MKLYPFYPAHSSNYTKGRGGRAVKYFTVHHTASFEDTLRYLWQSPSRNASSHFFVHPAKIEQYVDTDDTAWTNGNFVSNQESITVEVRGDWRGYKDQKTLDRLYELMVAVRKRYPHIQLNYHNQIASTACPADLRSKGYAKQAWDRATVALKPKPAPTPAPAPKITYKLILPKRVELIRDANLWNFNFTKWADAKAVSSFPKGHIVDVVAEATNSLGAKYLMTAYSYNEGKIRATNGFNVTDTKAFVAPAPVPLKPKPEVLPIKTDPEVPTESDVEKRLSALESIVKSITDFLTKLFKGWNGN